MPMFACPFGFDSRGFDWILKLANRTVFRVVPAVRAPEGMYQPAIRSGLAVSDDPVWVGLKGR